MDKQPYIGQKFSLNDFAVKVYGQKHKDRVYTVHFCTSGNNYSHATVYSDELGLTLPTSEIDEVTGHYPLVRLVKDGDDLKIVLRDRLAVEEIAADESKGWNQKERQVLEWHLENGWDLLSPEQIGVLTEAMLLSDSVRYASDTDDTVSGVDSLYTDIAFYQLRSWVEILLEKGEVTLDGMHFSSAGNLDN